MLAPPQRGHRPPDPAPSAAASGCPARSPASARSASSAASRALRETTAPVVRDRETSAGVSRGARDRDRSGCDRDRLAAPAAQVAARPIGACRCRTLVRLWRLEVAPGALFPGWGRLRARVAPYHPAAAELSVALVRREDPVETRHVGRGRPRRRDRRTVRVPAREEICRPVMRRALRALAVRDRSHAPRCCRAGVPLRPAALPVARHRLRQVRRRCPRPRRGQALGQPIGQPQPAWLAALMPSAAWRGRALWRQPSAGARRWSESPSAVRTAD